MMNFITEGYTLTENLEEAIFIDWHGNMMDGEFDLGYRGLDHNCIIPYQSPFDEMSHQEKWQYIHDQGVVRLVPETRIALISQGQELSKIQNTILASSDYQKEEY